MMTYTAYVPYIHVQMYTPCVCLTSTAGCPHLPTRLLLRYSGSSVPFMCRWQLRHIDRLPLQRDGTSSPLSLPSPALPVHVVPPSHLPPRLAVASLHPPVTPATASGRARPHVHRLATVHHPLPPLRPVVQLCGAQVAGTVAAPSALTGTPIPTPTRAPAAAGAAANPGPQGELPLLLQAEVRADDPSAGADLAGGSHGLARIHIRLRTLTLTLTLTPTPTPTPAVLVPYHPLASTLPA